MFSTFSIIKKPVASSGFVVADGNELSVIDVKSLSVSLSVSKDKNVSKSKITRETNPV